MLDVRDAEEYAEGHLAGAVNRPMDGLASAALPTDRLIVTYCNMHNHGYSRGERAAEELSALAIASQRWRVAIPPGLRAAIPSRRQRAKSGPVSSNRRKPPAFVKRLQAWGMKAGWPAAPA